MRTTRITFPNNTSRFQEESPASLLKALLFMVLLTACIVVIFVYRQQPATSDENRSLSSTESSDDIGPKTLPELADALTTIVREEEGEYSILFSDHKSSDQFSINHKSAYTAASVIKIPLLAVTYHLADTGDISLDEEIRISPSDIQDWGTGTIRYEPQPVTHTVREICQLLMEKSDNTAAYVLSNRMIGAEKTQQIIDSWGLSQTNVAENLTSNQDIEKLMRMMFEDTIANPTLTSEMISWMDNSDYENRIPGLLPDHVDVYHKIGNEVRIIHDVGVISFDGHEYYFGVLTREVPDLARAEETIAKLSKIVYDYMRNKR